MGNNVSCEVKGCKNSRVKGRWCYEHWKESLKGYKNMTPEIREELYMSYVTGDGNIKVLAARYGLSSACLTVILNELFENPPSVAVPEKVIEGRQNFADLWRTVGPWGIVHRFPELSFDELRKAKKDLIAAGYDLEAEPLVDTSSVLEYKMKVPIGEVLYIKKLWAKGDSKTSIFKHTGRNWDTIERIIKMDVQPIRKYVEEFLKNGRDMRPWKRKSVYDRDKDNVVDKAPKG